MSGLTVAGLRRACAHCASERAVLRERAERAEALIAEQSRLIGELRVRLTKIENIPTVKVHL